MKITKQRLREIIKEEFSEATDSMSPAHDELKSPAHDELNKAMAAIENAYKNEATRADAQQVVDELYRRFGRYEPSPEELMP